MTALHYMREFFNKFSVLIVYITALFCWLTCILMVRKNELTSMESVEFHCHISRCFLSVNWKRIYEFFYTSLTACRFCVICTTLKNVNMLGVVCKIEGDQYVLNIQVPAYILSLYITFYFIKYVQSYIWFTHTRAHVRARQ